MSVQQICFLDGARCGSLTDIAAELTVALSLDPPWYGNLGALDAILDTRASSDGRKLHIVWRHSASAREALGYGETCRWLEERRHVWDPADVPVLEVWLAEARDGVGATLFDAIVEVMERHYGVDLELA